MDKLNKNWNADTKTVLTKRLKTLVDLFNNSTTLYPFNARVLGFKLLKVESKEEMKGRIKELADILNVNVTMKIGMR